MGAAPSFSATSLNCGVIAPGETSTAFVTSAVFSAPATVTASISGDATNGALTVLSMTSFIIKDEVEFPEAGEGPHGENLKPVKVPVQITIQSSTGPDPSLSVEPGQSIQVNVQFAPTASTPYIPPTVFRNGQFPPSNPYDSAAVLVIESESWNESVMIPITAAVLGQQVPPPNNGLKSGSNYVLYNACNSLIDVSVTISIEQAIVNAPGSPSGVGFQLNAYAPLGAGSVWLQYFIFLQGGNLQGGVEYWNTHFPAPLIQMGSFVGDTLPVGTELKIALNNDSVGNVAKANFYVNKVKKGAIAVPTAFLVPVIGFQFNVVGPINDADVTLSTGAGKITYEASGGLVVIPTLPQCANLSTGTGEAANTVYTPMFVSWPQSPITQNFNLAS